MSLLIVFLLSNHSTAHEKTVFKKGRHKLGFISGYGFRKLGSMIDLKAGYASYDYYYKVVFFEVEYHYLLTGNKRWNLELLGQPQFNITRYKPINWYPPITDGYEVGINAAILGRLSVIRRHNFLSIYGSVGTGPLYVPRLPPRQASGFMFADNFFVGMNLKLAPKIYLDGRVGYRHVSNANIQQPNPGLNNMVFGGGIIADL